MKKIFLFVLTIVVSVACNEQPQKHDIQLSPSEMGEIDKLIITDNIKLCHLYREYVSQKELYRDVDEGIVELISFYDYIFYYSLKESIDKESGDVQYSIGDIKTKMWCYFQGFRFIYNHKSMAEGLYEHFRINNIILTEEWKRRIDVNSEEYMTEFEALKDVMKKEAEIWVNQE